MYHFPSMFERGAPFTGYQILETLRREEVPLFLSHAFIIIGLLAAVFSFVSRKLSPLLLWFSLFSFLYGLRMWLEFDTTRLLIHSSIFLDRLRQGSSFLVPIPAFFYFEAAGFLSRYGRKIAWSLTVIYLCFFFATLMYGRLPAIQQINSVLIIVSVASFTAVSLNRKNQDRDYVILRRGLMVFVAFILADNIGTLLKHFPDLEAYGFVFFLATLGYVAARNTLHRDQQLAEIQKELDVARRIQMGNLPAPYPNSSVFRVATRYVPMTSVAGDFYDFLVADGRQTGLLIADVSGHGVPAALITSMVKLAASSQRTNAGAPAALLSGMNEALYGNTHNQFVTAAYVYLNADTGRFRYAAAAHPPMLLLRNESVAEVTENGLLLAAFPLAAFTMTERALQPGDRIVLYTDGIIEAANENEEEFGQERLQKTLRDGSKLSAEEMADRIIHAVQQWSTSQEDDLTVVVCDYATIASESA
jgi:sigma-B regulation protein RsbU (phosphoserine phosphatase)